MTICPVALIVGCKKCPLFKVCPAKGSIGNYDKEAAAADAAAEAAAADTAAPEAALAGEDKTEEA
jgi:hypothetical protein